MSDLNLVTVYRSAGMLGAQVVKGKLEAYGIPAMLRYESAGLVFGLTVDGLGMVEEAEALVSEDPEGETPADNDADSETTKQG
jgi:hypothetical protein